MPNHFTAVGNVQRDFYDCFLKEHDMIHPFRNIPNLRFDIGEHNIFGKLKKLLINPPQVNGLFARILEGQNSFDPLLRAETFWGKVGRFIFGYKPQNLAIQDLLHSMDTKEQAIKDAILYGQTDNLQTIVEEPEDMECEGGEQEILYGAAAEEPIARPFNVYNLHENYSCITVSESTADFVSRVNKQLKEHNRY